MRVGIGYDLHRLAPNRKLILGGVEIPHALGLLGHSDADVLTHAIIDAILGAAALGDIGSHFPDTDPAYEGINSLILLQKVKAKVENLGYSVQNVGQHNHRPTTKVGASYSRNAAASCRNPGAFRK